MAKKSSFSTVTEQIINYNNNVTQLLSKLNELSTTSSDQVTIQTTDQFGVISQSTVQSLGFLKSEIDRLNNNINSFYSIDNGGAIVATSQNRFRKVVVVDINKEPNTINSLGTVNNFQTKTNWFFDALLNPQLIVEFDLNNSIDDDVRKVLTRRYIVNFAKDENENLTPNGQVALNSFNSKFRGQTNIVLEDFLIWHTTTTGLINTNNPLIDEQMFDLEPNALLYNGLFSVLKTEEDSLNRKLWYHLNTLTYIVTDTSEEKQLKQGDYVIVNQTPSSTRYKIIEVSTSDVNPRVRFELVEGVQPIPVLIDALKIYSPVINNRKVKVSIGYDESNVVFIKALNSNDILSKDWSVGTAYNTNNLTLSSNNSDNGTSLEQYYIDKVFDYGKILDDLVETKIPSKMGSKPNAPVLNTTDFKVVQINKHLTDNPDSKLLKEKHVSQKSLKSEITQMTEAIRSKERQKRTTRFNSKSAERQFDNELKNIIENKNSKSKQLQSTVREIIDISSVTKDAIKTTPKFKVRGFWSFPEPIFVKGTRPQEVIQFKIEYKYTSKDGKESSIERFTVTNTGSGSENAAYSNWVAIKTDARIRSKDPSSGVYVWEIQDVADADTPNINQLDIPINTNEKVDIRIKSLSEVGYPETPMESDWSEVMTIEFPDDLNNVLGDNEFVLKEAEQEELRIKFQEDLNSRGLDEHLSNQTSLNDKNFHHPSENILSGFKSKDGIALDLYEYLQNLTNRITDLEERVSRIKGEMRVTIFRNNDDFVVKNNSEITFNVECENYAEEFKSSGVPTGRVYANNIYVIREFLLKIENVAQTSPLGLLSNRNYFVSSDFVNINAPQTFWVSEQDNLLFNTESGETRTQLDNQFLWVSNYLSEDATTVKKLNSNIGSTLTSNSLTEHLSSNEFNLGVNTTTLQFQNSNSSLFEIDKWVDDSPSIGSTNKFLTTIHPSIERLDSLTETNSDKVKIVDPNDENSITVPLNIYFKLNSVDPNNGSGKDYDYVDFNKTFFTTKHTKTLKFFLENEADNRPFQFTINFNLSRSKLVLSKFVTAKFIKFVK